MEACVRCPILTLPDVQDVISHLGMYPIPNKSRPGENNTILPRRVPIQEQSIRKTNAFCGGVKTRTAVANTTFVHKKMTCVCLDKKKKL